MKESIEPQYVNGGRAAKIVGLPYSTFRKTDLPYYRFGKVRLYKISELEKSLERFRVAPASEILA